MKNAKKILCGLMAVGMIAALCACGSTPAPTATDSAAALSGTVSTNGSTSMEKVIGSL